VFWFLNTFAPLNYPIGFVANYPPLLLGFLVAMLPVTLLARKVNLTYQKYCLEADKVAAEVVGKTQLIQILRKIDSMGLSDIEMRKKESDRIWKRDGVSPWPSISTRIQSLETS
jgi:Zn-dependent protease with chaperone function